MRDFDLRRLARRLIDDAVTLGEANQRGELLRRRVRVEVELQPDALKPCRHFFGYAQRASKIQIAFRVDGSFSNLNPYRSRHCTQGHSGTGCERLQQHVARAGHQSAASRPRVKTRFDERLSGFDLARNPLPDTALGLQGDERGLRTVAIALLEWAP